MTAFHYLLLHFNLLQYTHLPVFPHHTGVTNAIQGNYTKGYLGLAPNIPLFLSEIYKH